MVLITRRKTTITICWRYKGVSILNLLTESEVDFAMS